MNAEKELRQKAADDEKRRKAGEQLSTFLKIRPPKWQVAEIQVVGIDPQVQNRIGQDVKDELMRTQAGGDIEKTKKKARNPKDFEKMYREALHVSTEGWYGFPCSGIRNALIRACSLSPDVEMTTAKMCIFVEPDGFETDGTPLVRITKGEPRRVDSIVRIPKTGVVNVVARPMWDPGWEATIKIRFLGSHLSLESVVNLMVYAGECVGTGEGRPFSKRSCGCGWGRFRPQSEIEAAVQKEKTA